MEAKPLRIVPHSNSGKGLEKRESPSVKLGLGISGSDSVEKEKAVSKQVRSVFTPAQLVELQQQAFVFKYIAAGLPVPLYLVLPIWKTVVASSSAIDVYDQQLKLGFSPEDFDHRRNMMDPEPGRCRRTDGKKWRCSKDVIEGQKYCERHIHRGRNRSRKPVVGSQIASSYTTPSKNLCSGSEKSNTRLSVSTSASLQLMTQSTSTNTSRSHIPVTACSKYEHNKSICRIKDTAVSAAATTVASIVTAASPITAIPNTNNMNHEIYRSSCNIDRKNDFIHLVGNKNISSGGNNIKIGSYISPRLGFSPNSVLQVVGANASCYYQSNPESEPGRCRRTDGKKWRCGRDIVPDQKYCGRHMHRGTKRHAEASPHDAITTNSTTATSNAWPLATVKTLGKAHSEEPSTNLSISIPASPRPSANDNKSTSSGSDTTITDTIFSACETSNLSL